MMAVPSKRITKTVVQCDNTTLSIMLVGDENIHYFITADKIPVFETEKGYCYGYVDNDSLRISDFIAHEKPQRTEAETAFLESTLKTLQTYLYEARNSVERLVVQQRRSQSTYNSFGEKHSYLGEKRGLVILVEFDNLSMKTENPNTVFNRMFNEKGYSENGSIGSVHDYFYDQSYGKFILDFDVVGPVKVSRNYEYYGGNSELFGKDKNVHEMVIEACRLTDDNVNFKDYDWDGDGEVDQVFIVYAGYGEHAGAPANTIWPHENRLGSNALSLDGVTVNTYACSSELIGFFGKTISGIGTPCHEFCHCLGIPDFYDTDYSGAFGMSYWDIMNSGSYAGPEGYGEVPYGFTAYERWIAGWLEPIELKGTQKICNMANLGDKPEAYIIYNEGNRNEYYLIENHQSSRWFKYVNKYDDIHGMIITHVDFDERAWKTNSVNPTPEHQRMTIIPADNKYGNEENDLRGDIWPGINNVQWLTNTSHSDNGGKLYNANTDWTYNMNRAIGNIKENEDGTITFDVIFDNEIYAPEALQVTATDNDGYTVKWNEVIGAKSYDVEQSSVKIGSNFELIKKNEVTEGIIGTEVSMKWLIENARTTNCRVRSVIDGIASEWSDFIKVESTTDIKEIVEDADGNAVVYSLDGKRRIPVRQGINIIKNKNITKKYIQQ